jgi:hypothetical protein
LRDQLSLKQFDEAQRTLDRVCQGQDSASKLCLKSRVHFLAGTGRLKEARAAMASMAFEFPPVTSRDYTLDAATYANYLDDIASATKSLRMALKKPGSTTTIILLMSPRGGLLPEEISKDPEWLATWADPRLRELMTEYRKNIANFRKGG